MHHSTTVTRFRRRPGRSLALTTAALLLAGSLAGCGSGQDTTTVDVWLMKDSASDAFTDALVRDYEKRYPGRQVRVTVQPWQGVNEKVTRALTGDGAPDVIEVGTTHLAQYVATRQVRDLSADALEPGGSDWIPGLAESGKVGGSLYGVPYYAANRVVVYRKDLFAQAGVDKPPRTRSAWLRATERLDALPGRQGIYLPGRNWYVLAGFVWDEGGDLAVERSGRWSGALDTPEALRGMDFYGRLQALGDASKTADEARPAQAEVFARGEAAQMIATPGEARAALRAAPELRGKVGFFPVPGRTAGKPGAVFTGGSLLMMPKRAADRKAGWDFIALLTGDRWQKRLARTMSYVPNRNRLAPAVADDPGTAAMAEAAKNGHAAPNSPEWGTVEADNPMKTYQTEVLTGADPAQAAERASGELTALLNGEG